MGFNTVAFFLNDQADVVEGRGDEVLDTLGRSMRSGQGEEHGPGQMQVLPSAHADTQQIIVAGGNRITRLGYAYGLSHEPEDIIKQLAEQHGFRVVRKKSS